MNIFKRLFKISQAEIHAAVDKMEDPVKMTEQGLRELREDLAQATESYAKVKALAIRTENEQIQTQQQSMSYAEKAVLIMQQAQTGQVDLVLPSAEIPAALPALPFQTTTMRTGTG